MLLFKFHVNFPNPANSRFWRAAAVAVAPYTQAPSGATVPQAGTQQLLDALGAFLMHRAAYRNRWPGWLPQESLLVTHAVTLGSGASATVGVRWYELRNLCTRAPFVYQQGTFAPDATYRWTSSIAMDKVGDIAVGYSASSSSIYPDIRYTGRVATDPLGTMRAEATIVSGSSAQTRSFRWGDYSSMSVDPVDDCTMWYTQEYLPFSGSSLWGTRLFSFKFPSCL